jgi:hypothetical protein
VRGVCAVRAPLRVGRRLCCCCRPGRSVGRRRRRQARRGSRQARNPSRVRWADAWCRPRGDARTRAETRSRGQAGETGRGELACGHNSASAGLALEGVGVFNRRQVQSPLSLPRRPEMLGRTETHAGRARSRLACACAPSKALFMADSLSRLAAAPRRAATTSHRDPKPTCQESFRAENSEVFIQRFGLVRLLLTSTCLISRSEDAAADACSATRDDGVAGTQDSLRCPGSPPVAQ